MIKVGRADHNRAGEAASPGGDRRKMAQLVSLRAFHDAAGHYEIARTNSRPRPAKTGRRSNPPRPTFLVAMRHQQNQAACFSPSASMLMTDVANLVSV